MLAQHKSSSWFLNQNTQQNVDFNSKLIQEINQGPLEQFCEFKKLSLFKDELEIKQKKNQWFDLKCGLKSNFIIFTLNNGQIFLGFLKLQQEVKFQLLEGVLRVQQAQQSLDQNKRKKQTYGIKFSIENEKKKLLIQLIVKQNSRQRFKCFLNKLQTKFILQLNFHNYFRPLRKIGKGFTSCVFQAIRNRDQQLVAIKSFKKSTYFNSNLSQGKIAFYKQFQILTKVNHPNICKFKGAYQTQNSIYIILERLQITLYTYLARKGKLDKNNIKRIMMSLLKGINYLQSQLGIAHRDLKLENIMLKKNSRCQLESVIIDFGLAEKINAQEVIFSKCGTPGYVAPQILKNQKNYQSCDIFSAGVIFFMLLTNQKLFDGNNVQQILQNNRKCKFSKEKLLKLSALEKNLFQKMIEKLPNKRITAEEALKHEYFVSQEYINKKLKQEIQQEDCKIQS